jgi:hypothetical protein
VFEESLFNSFTHRLLQSEIGWYSFYLLEHSDRKIISAIHFNVQDTLAKSPLRSPFGSIESSASLSADLLERFLIFVQEELKKMSVKKLSIKHYPNIYNAALTDSLKPILEILHYKTIATETSSIIPIENENTLEIFHRSEKRKLIKNQRSGCIFQSLPIDQLKTVFEFIQQARVRKNYSLSMSFADLEQTVKKFPDKFFLFGVFLSGDLIAAAITIRVKSNILYDFYHDHDDAYDELSPVVMLVDGIYRFCFQEKIQLLDLGTSSIGDQPNVGLLHFKTLLGGIPSSKITYEKEL